MQHFYAAKGVYASWDRLGDISVIVDLLQNVRKQVGSVLGTPHQGISHVTPDTSSSIKRVADKLSELALGTFNPMWKENDVINPVVDTIAIGEHKLKSATLATFNKKVRGLMVGELPGADEDEIPEVAFNFADNNEDRDG